jgi:PAS domain S-box-containing protein
MPDDLPPPSILKRATDLESKDPRNVVAIFDRDGYYLYASANHDQALGYTPDELTQMHLSTIVHKPDHHAAWVLRTIVALSPKPIHFSSRLVAKSGSLVHVSGDLRHVREPHGEMYFITCVKIVSNTGK